MASLWQSFMDAPDYFEESPWFPNPVICIRDLIRTGTSETIARLPWNGIDVWLSETWGWISASNYTDPRSFLLPLLLAVLFTLLRIFLNWSLFKRIPVWCDLTKEAADKFPESIWKSLFYIVTWVWSVYIVSSGENNSFFNLRSHWDTWSPHLPIQSGPFWLYMMQMGFYLHCTYATLYLETIRKDFSVLMTHHILTLGLLLFSFIVRFHVIGILLLAIHDFGDVVLEISKTVFYFKDRGHRNNPGTEFLANVCFAIFTLQHLMCRLYWFPTKVIYSSGHISVLTFPGGPYYLLFNIMLWGLYAMQVYWFKFILQLLWKIFVLGQKLEDTREYEEEEEEKGKKD